MQLKIYQVEPQEYHAVIKFYEEVDKHRSVEQTDKVFLAKEGEQIIGVVRLAYENGFTVLRGMQVRPSHRRQGIGAQMLKVVDVCLEIEECFCLPYGHLETFYGLIGFKKIDATRAPIFLQQRLKEYQARDASIIVMGRP